MIESAPPGSGGGLHCSTGGRRFQMT